MFTEFRASVRLQRTLTLPQLYMRAVDMEAGASISPRMDAIRDVLATNIGSKPKSNLLVTIHTHSEYNDGWLCNANDTDGEVLVTGADDVSTHVVSALQFD